MLSVVDALGFTEGIAPVSELIIPPVRRDAARLPRPRWPVLIDNQYARALRDYATSLRRLVDPEWRNQIKPLIKQLQEREAQAIRLNSVARTDDEADEVNKRLDDLLTRMLAVLSAAQAFKLARDALNRVSDFAVRQVTLEFDVFKARAFINRVQLERLTKARVSQNVSLIKSIPAQYHRNIERVIAEGITKSRGISSIEAEIAKIGQTTRTRAAVIARDQVGSAYGEAKRAVYRANALKQARWITMLDRRVRPKHQNYEGRVFDLETGINGIYPGDEVLCRCVSQPVIADLQKLAVGELP